MGTRDNVCDLFFSCAERSPGKAAIIDRDGSAETFGKLAEDVKATAAYFHSKGIRKGDRVLVFVPIGIPLYRTVLALFHMGAVAVFLDEWVSRERLEVCCRIAKCKAFIAPFRLRALAFFIGELRKIPVWLGTRYTPATSADPQALTHSSDTALITFTTGSTGIPKAADRTHGFLAAQFGALVDKIRPETTDVDMPVLPIVLLLNLGTGVTSVIADFNSRKPETIDTEKIWMQIISSNVNRFVASPFVVEQMAASGFNRKTRVRFFTGGAPVFPFQAERMKKGLPGSSVEIVYGSTEAEPISTISAEELISEKNKSEKGLCVGKPYHGTTVRILPVTEKIRSFRTEEELDSASLPTGKPGEIVVSGKHVLRHYIDNPEAEKQNKIFIGENVWHRTGDSGFLDENGNLFLCGRCSSLITDEHGETLAPFLWEGWFLTLPGVSMGTIAQHDGKIIAVIECAPEKENEVEKLILGKYPFSSVVFLPRLPRDPRHFSKIDYGKLKEILPKKQAGRQNP
ncbi:MAG TPA: AMP-binding protein [Bacteroidia bacterium]|nr:AMP-binding protein [Bacteroidia bacterium]